MENKEINQAEFELKFEATLIEAENWWNSLEDEDKVTFFINETELKKEDLEVWEKVRNICAKIQLGNAWVDIEDIYKICNEQIAKKGGLNSSQP